MAENLQRAETLTVMTRAYDSMGQQFPHRWLAEFHFCSFGSRSFFIVDLVVIYCGEGLMRRIGAEGGHR